MHRRPYFSNFPEFLAGATASKDKKKNCFQKVFDKVSHRRFISKADPENGR